MGTIQNDYSGPKVGWHIDEDGRGRVLALQQPFQQHVSAVDGDAYQAIAIDTGITAKTQTLLHLRNDSTSKRVVFTYLRMQAVTDVTYPAVTDYFEIGMGRTVTSGGSAATPVNVNSGSGKSAPVTVTAGDPTMAGTFELIDRRYIKDNAEEHTHRKEVALFWRKTGLWKFG